MQLVCFYIYLSILFSGSILGYAIYKYLDNKGKIINFLLSITFLSETLAIIMTKIHKRHTAVYHIYNIIEIIIISLYFMQAVEKANQRKYILWIIVFWSAIGFGNMLIQPITSLNSNMLIIECITIVPMALYSLYKILLDDKIMNVTAYPHFWIWTCFLLYQCSTYFFWAFFDILILKSHYRNALIQAQIIVNILAYAGIGLSFFLYPKMKAE